MRLLMVSHGYPPTVSGVSLVVQKLARAMVARGHRVMLVTGSDRGTAYETEDEGVRLVRVRSWANPFWREGPVPTPGPSQIDDLITSFEPDLIHLHDAALVGLQGLQAGRRAALPVVSTCYYVPHFLAQYLGGEWVEGIAWAYSVWLFNQCHHVVFATQAHHDCFVEHGLGAPTTIISNGIDTSRYAPGERDPAIAERYGLRPGKRLLFVGRLARDKELDVLIRAMTHLGAEDHPALQEQAQLYLVGRGDDRARLEGLAAELGVGERVHFVGFVPEEDMPALYRHADLFLIAATSEVQSLPTLQAMATGIPVVAADALALPELVKDGVNGYLVTPGDDRATALAIQRVLRDPELAARLGQAALATARPHDDRYTLDAYERLYGQLTRGLELEAGVA